MILELKNINKTYVTKTGVTFRALSNVSTSFDDTGMVFIVGKSGSGKSTMLNIIGGLDSYDSGDMLIAGKSSRRMRAAEVDSFRNTLIGFIFQEFNLIDTLTVYENVGLALDMQSNRDKSKVDDVLNKMGIADKAGSKAKFLSGGQRQRVAIARALVKNPRILLADEPTGALDSTTGVEMMKEFKAISKDRLVIIVTHDIEKAIEYGDRIIEMKDGKIYRDVRRKQDGEKVEFSGVRIVSDALVCIDKNNVLNDADMEKINESISLSGRKTFVNIETDPRRMKALFPNLREAVSEAYEGADAASNRPADSQEDAANDGTESTAVSGEKFVPYKPKDTHVPEVQYLKSRMPTGKAFRMGAHNLNHKKGRLVLTVIMAVFAFMFFAVAESLANYDIKGAYTQTIAREEFSTLSIINSGNYSYYNQGPTRIKDSDFEEMKKENPNLAFYKQKKLTLPIDRTYNTFSGVVEIDDVSKLGLSVKTGWGSPKLDGIDIVVISESRANEILWGRIMPAGVNDIPALIGCSISIAGTDYKIGGVFVSSSYEFNQVLFSAEGFIDAYAAKTNYSAYGFQYTIKVTAGQTNQNNWNPGVNYQNLTFASYSSEMLSSGSYKLETELTCDYMSDEGWQTDVTKSITNGGTTLRDENDIFLYVPEFDYGFNSRPDLSSHTAELIDYLNADEGREFVLYYNNKPVYVSQNFFVRAVISPASYGVSQTSAIIVSDSLLQSIYSNAISTTNIIVGLSGNRSDTRALVNYVQDNGFTFEAGFVSSYRSLLMIFSVLNVVLLVLALALALLVVVLLFNFISSSIELTRKQIGILRALGAKKSDTFKIYALEGFIVTALSLIIAFAALLIIAPFINLIASGFFEMYIPIFVFGPMVYLLTVLLGFAVTIISILIPLRKFVRITPIDAISDKS